MSINVKFVMKKIKGSIGKRKSSLSVLRYVLGIRILRFWRNLLKANF